MDTGVGPGGSERRRAGLLTAIGPSQPGQRHRTRPGRRSSAGGRGRPLPGAAAATQAGTLCGSRGSRGLRPAQRLQRPQNLQTSENTAMDLSLRNQVLIRSRVLRENGKYIPKQSFLTRKYYFNNPEDGFFKKTKRKVVPPSPMTDPTMLTDMMKGNVTNVLPMILIGGWINMTFSGFVTTKVPFPLTLRFKPMLQQGIELLTLDASWVSSASWYFLNVFGLRSIYSLILGQDNAADQSRMMQEQMTGAAMAMPADTNKAFKTEWEALELTDHQWALDDVEEELMAKDLHFEGMFKKELQTSIF
uniref:ER membrane protein complex subunit 3 n=1 Tax=Pongo abelii TaxID=9601 RepID=A0A8I5TDB9_PONAB